MIGYLYIPILAARKNASRDLSGECFPVVSYAALYPLTVLNQVRKVAVVVILATTVRQVQRKLLLGYLRHAVELAVADEAAELVGD